jgi:hypothetical protein
LAGQALADRGTDAAGSSGDQGDAPGQLLTYHSGWWFDNRRADGVHPDASKAVAAERWQVAELSACHLTMVGTVTHTL